MEQNRYIIDAVTGQIDYNQLYLEEVNRNNDPYLGEMEGETMSQISTEVDEYEVDQDLLMLSYVIDRTQRTQMINLAMCLAGCMNWEEVRDILFSYKQEGDNLTEEHFKKGKKHLLNMMGAIKDHPEIYINQTNDVAIEEILKRVRNLAEFSTPTNYCTRCGVDMGVDNPRQLCGKTRCLNTIQGV